VRRTRPSYDNYEPSPIHVRSKWAGAATEIGDGEEVGQVEPVGLGRAGGPSRSRFRILNANHASVAKDEIMVRRDSARATEGRPDRMTPNPVLTGPALPSLPVSFCILSSLLN